MAMSSMTHCNSMVGKYIYKQEKDLCFSSRCDSIHSVRLVCTATYVC